MNGLFERNNHSNSAISFSEVKPEFLPTIRTVFTHYDLSAPSEIVQVKELELNSNNFKVTTANSTTLLRKQISNNRADKVVLEIKLLEFLLSQGVRVSTPLRTRAGELFVEANEHLFCAYKFIHGVHYAGSFTELKEAASEIAKLHMALKLAPFQDEIRSCFTFLTNPLSTTILDQIAEHVGDSSETDLLYKEHAELIRSSLADAARIEPLIEAHKQIIHGDLHPHNFLFEHSELKAILDLGEMRYGATLEDIAFSLHRLSRQLVITLGLHSKAEIQACILECVDLYLEAYSSINNAINSDAKAYLPTLIKRTALKKIFTILNANYLENNTRWNFDLRKHLNSLKEASFYEQN